MKKMILIAIAASIMSFSSAPAQETVTLTPQQIAFEELSNKILTEGSASLEDCIAASVSTNKQLLAVLHSSCLSFVDSATEQQLLDMSAAAGRMEYRLYSHTPGKLTTEIRRRQCLFSQQRLSNGDSSKILMDANRSFDIALSILGKNDADEMCKNAYRMLKDNENKTPLILNTIALLSTRVGERNDEIADAQIMAIHSLSSLTDGANAMALMTSRIRDLNAVAFKQAVMIARNGGRPTVGVVIPEYKALLDAEKTGIGFTEALEGLGWGWPGDWDAGVAMADKIIADVYSGELIKPSNTHLAIICLYKGTDALKEFIDRYNKL